MRSLFSGKKPSLPSLEDDCFIKSIRYDQKNYNPSLVDEVVWGEKYAERLRKRTAPRGRYTTRLTHRDRSSPPRYEIVSNDDKPPRFLPHEKRGFTSCIFQSFRPPIPMLTAH